MDRDSWQRQWQEDPGRVKYSLPMHMMYFQGYCNLWETPHSTKIAPSQQRHSLAHSRSLPLLKDGRKNLYAPFMRTKRNPWENKLKPREEVKGPEAEIGFYVPVTEHHHECPLVIFRKRLETQFGSIPLAFNTFTTLRGRDTVNRSKWARVISVHFGYGGKYSNCIFDLVMKEKCSKHNEKLPEEGTDEYNNYVLTLSEIANCHIATGGVCDTRRDAVPVRIFKSQSENKISGDPANDLDNTCQSTMTRMKREHKFSESHPMPMRRNLSLSSSEMIPLGERVSTNKDFFSFSRTPTLRQDVGWHWKGQQQTILDPNVGPGTYNVSFEGGPWDHAPVLPWRKADGAEIFPPAETEVNNIASNHYMDDHSQSGILPRRSRGDTLPRASKVGACWNQSRRFTGVVGPSSACLARHAQRRVGQMGRLDDPLGSKLP